MHVRLWLAKSGSRYSVMGGFMIDVKLSELLPHEPPMVLLDSIQEIAPGRVLAQVCFTEGAPQSTPEGVPSAWGLEMIAQAAALLVVTSAGRQGCTQGRVIKVARFKANQHFLPVATRLNVEVTQIVASESGVYLFEGSVTVGDSRLVEAALTLFAQ